MKSMRQLINLMESVASVPGIGSGSNSSLKSWQLDAIATIYISKLNSTSFPDKAKQETIDTLYSGGVISSKQIPEVKQYLEDFDQDETLPDNFDDNQSWQDIGSEYDPKLGENLDEIKSSTYADYIKKSSKDSSERMHNAAAYADISSHADDTDASADDWLSAAHKEKSISDRRLAGIDKAADRLAKGRVTTNEKSTSEKQARFMAAAAHDSDFAKKVGIDTDVAKEFNKADTGTKQLSNAMKKIKEDESEMQTAATSAVDSADAEFDAAQTANTEIDESNIGSNMDSELTTRAISMFDQLVNSFVDPEDALNVVMSRFEEEGATPEELSSINGAIMSQFGTDDANDDYGDFHNDMEDDAYALASAGYGSDEDYGGDNFPMEDINNGYKDINRLNGDDYFPNGADSSVVKSVGPSGARQGDNPEQKKMEVAETHKELVYSYRKFLKESNIK